MDTTSIHSENAPKAQGPYSQAIVAGDLVFCAGQIPLDPATGSLVQGDIAVQTARVLDNLALPRGARIEIECVAVRI